MRPKYHALRVVTIALKAFTVLALVLGLSPIFIGGGLVFIPQGYQRDTVALATNLLGGIVAGLLLWALSDFFALQIHAEENQRKMIAYLKYIATKSPARPTPSLIEDEEDDEDDSAYVPVPRPAAQVRTKAYGGYDRWEPQDLVQIRSRRGSMKNKAVSVNRDGRPD